MYSDHDLNVSSVNRPAAPQSLQQRHRARVAIEPASLACRYLVTISEMEKVTSGCFEWQAAELKENLGISYSVGHTHAPLAVSYRVKETKPATTERGGRKGLSSSAR